MNAHQRRVLVRIAAEIDRYRGGRLPMLDLLNNVWGLFEAAELPDGETRNRFLERYEALTAADDARQPGMPAGPGSAADVDAALGRLEAWARAVRSDGPDGDVSE